MNATSRFNLVVKVKLINSGVKRSNICFGLLRSTLLSCTNYVFISSFSHTVLRAPKDLSCPPSTCLASRGSYAKNNCCDVYIVFVNYCRMCKSVVSGLACPTTKRFGLLHPSIGVIISIFFHVLCFCMLQQYSYVCLVSPIMSVSALTYRNPPRDLCAPRVTR